MRNWAIIGMVMAMAGTASADLLSEFFAEYPAAAARLEEAYRHVRVVGKETRTNSAGSFVWTENVEFLREGDRVRGKQTVVESAEAEWPAGSLRVFGGGNADFFKATRLPTQPQLHLDSFGPAADFERRVHLTCQPLFAAYCFRDARLVDYLAKDGRRAVSATMTKLDGEEVVEVTMEVIVPKTGAIRDHFFFVPHTWALAGWTVPVQPSTCQGRITYEPNSNPPKIRKVDTWFEGKTADVKNYRWLSEVSSVEFGPIPAEEFTPEGAGVKGDGK